MNAPFPNAKSHGSPPPQAHTDRPRPDIAILLDHFGSGGVERVACHIANGLQKRGFCVEMIALHDSGPVRPLLNKDIVVRTLRSAPGRPRADRLKAAAPAIAAYLRNHSPRIFHAPGNHTIRPAAMAISLARFRGAFVAKITNPILTERLRWRRRWLRRMAYRWALRKAHRIMVLSRQGVDQLRTIDSRLAARSIVVHNPYVSEAMMHGVAGRAPADPPVILSMGRLSHQKNQAMLLRTAATLRDRPWRLRICGTGPDEPALRMLADELGIADRVDFAGFVADALPEYLAATVLALSSRWEGLPATLLEAVACGCPVVSTASSPGLVDLMHEIGASRPVAIDDEEGFALLLRQALDGTLPTVPPQASLLYGIEASCDEHAAEFAELLQLTA